MAYVKLGVMNEDLAYYVLTCLALMTPELSRWVKNWNSPA